MPIHFHFHWKEINCHAFEAFSKLDLFSRYCSLLDKYLQGDFWEDSAIIPADFLVLISSARRVEHLIRSIHTKWGKFGQTHGYLCRLVGGILANGGSTEWNARCAGSLESNDKEQRYEAWRFRNMINFLYKFNVNSTQKSFVLLGPRD